MASIPHRIMKIEEFANLVGQKFIADCSPKPTELKLVEVSPLKTYGSGDRQPFILVFHTPPEKLLVSGSYVMRCGSFGPDAVYISDMLPPPGSEAGYYYQAVFN
jgi:hypothetical protein